MTPRLVGVVFYSNLLSAGRAIEASTSFPSANRQARLRSEFRGTGDAAVWTQRQQQAQCDADGYLLEEGHKQLSSNADTLQFASGVFSSSSISAAEHYEFYARMLAAPEYPSVNLYA